jgi:hypothetical protein
MTGPSGLRGTQIYYDNTGPTGTDIVDSRVGDFFIDINSGIFYVKQ